jgi:Pentapeptide repeats (8 copies)
MKLNNHQLDKSDTVIQKDTSKSSKIWDILHFLSASTIIGLITWGVTNYISIKNQQQEQLDTFVDSLSELMISHNLYANQIAQLQASPATGSSTKNVDFPEPVVARAYVLNTLKSFDGIWPIGDVKKKQELLKFLYESKMIGWCPSGIRGTGALAETAGPQNEACKNAKFSLKDSNLEGVRFGEVSETLNGINLTRTNLKSASFARVDLTNATFISSILMKADFSGVRLKDADLSRTYLQNATFKEATLTGANFSSAQICGADFRNARDLEKASFQAASYDANTKLPLAATGKPVQLSGAFLRPCISPASR